MIELTDLPTEQTTAATNIALAVVALAAIVSFVRLRNRDPWKVTIWSAFAICLLVASVSAAVAHGLELSAGVYAVTWALVYLTLALMIACVVIGTVYDLWGERVSRRAAPIMTIIAVLFFAATRVDDAFVVFVLYETLFSGLACLGYGYLALSTRLPGAGLVSAGLLVTLLAAAVQATRIVPQITIVWVFDHNGQFHLLQVVGLILMIAGLLLVALRVGRRSEVAAWSPSSAMPD